MSFKRWLTSVFCSCILLSSILVVPAVAVDDDNFYSIPAVSDGSASVAPASLGGIVLASTGDYSSQLSIIITHLATNNNYLSMIYSYLSGLAEWRNSLLTNTARIRDYSSVLSGISSGVSSISDKVGTETTLSAISDKVATETSLAKLVGTFSSRIYDIGPSYVDYGKFIYATFGAYSDLFSPNPSRHIGFTNLLSSVGYALTYDGNNLFEGDRTLYSRIRQLQEVLASDDDLAMREDQKENVDQVKKDFITGQSGKTSLGKDDFGSLSSVGGTFKDITSLNGQSSITDFTSGLTDADTAGQGWFSQSTKDALDSVSGSTTSESPVSTFSDDGLYSEDVDPDPYNMGNFEDNYSWLWGEK